MNANLRSVTGLERLEAPEEAGMTPSQALELLEDELLAIDPKTLVFMNLDVPAAAMTVLGALEVLESCRPALVELCGEEKVRSLDRLELIARATLHAHARYRVVETGTQLAPLLKELTKMRDVLLAEARALVAREVIEPGLMGELTGVHGHRNLCVDVLQLVSLFQTNWDAVRGACGVTEADLARAESLADRLARMIGQREQGAQSPATDLRRRAFTLLVQTYEETRRLVSYLRWYEGDAERIAPSLWAGRGRRRASSAAIDAIATDSSSLAPTEGPVRNAADARSMTQA
jgi:hypothetical protein